MKLTIAWLYPDLMSTYGDRGNIFVLKKRSEWRGIKVIVKQITLETATVELEKSDLLFMGGAQDRQQKLAGNDFLHHKGPVMKKLIENGIPGLFVCAAYQAIGHYYQPYQGEKIVGPGIFDLYTEHPGDQKKRLIGNVVAKLFPSFWGAQRLQNPDSGHLPADATHQALQAGARMTIVGFENHGGRTYLGPKLKPLAKIINGFGNNGKDGYEGAVYKNSIGSYFHGPLLPKNPVIADWLIQKVLEVKYRKKILLEKLDDSLEEQAKEFIINRY